MCFGKWNGFGNVVNFFSFNFMRSIRSIVVKNWIDDIVDGVVFYCEFFVLFMMVSFSIVCKCWFFVYDNCYDLIFMWNGFGVVDSQVINFDCVFIVECFCWRGWFLFVI